MSATTAQLSHVYPARQPSQRARPPGARRLRRGGAGAGSSAPRSTSSSRTTCAAGRASFVEALAARHQDYDVLFASKAFPCTAVYRALAEEGLACDVASGGELALALARRLRRAAHLHARQRQVGRRAARGPRGRRRPRSCSTRSTTSSAWAAIARSSSAIQEVLLRVTPDVSGDTHHAISTGQADSKFGFSLDQARDAIARLDGRPIAAPGGAALPHRIPAVRARALPRRGAGDRRRSATSRSTTSAAAWPSPTRRTSSRRSPEQWVEAIVEAAHAELGRGQAPAARARPRARRQLDGHAVHGRDDQAQRLDLGGRRRRDVRQPAPDDVRGSLRGG